MPPLDATDVELAWQVSEHTVLTPGDIQALLTIDDPVRRTRAMRGYLRRERNLAARFPTVPHIEGLGSVSLN